MIQFDVTGWSEIQFDVIGWSVIQFDVIGGSVMQFDVISWSVLYFGGLMCVVDQWYNMIWLIGCKYSKDNISKYFRSNISKNLFDLIILTDLNTIHIIYWPDVKPMNTEN